MSAFVDDEVSVAGERSRRLLAEQFGGHLPASAGGMADESFAHRYANPSVAALAIAGLCALTLVGVWIFEYGLGLVPCQLCLQQRWPYYITVPLALVVAAGAARRASPGLLKAGFAVLALTMLVSAGLGAYHAGVEWNWWEGPQDCAAAGTGFAAGSATDLLKRIQSTRVIRCDEAAWRDPVLHLSLAGWNVLISLALSSTAVAALVGLSRR